MVRSHFHGIITGLVIATPSDLWSPGGGLYPFPTVAAATTIVSSSVNDAPAGTGALTAHVAGLDANLKVATETVILNGTTPVNLVNSYLRINRVRILTAGSGGTNAGTISVKQAATVIGSIVIGAGRSQAAIYTANASYAQVRVGRIYLAATNAVAGTVKGTLWTRKSGGVWENRYVTSVYGTNKSSDWIDLGGSIGLDAGEDIRMNVSTTTDTTDVAGGFQIVEGSVSELSMF